MICDQCHCYKMIASASGSADFYRATPVPKSDVTPNKIIHLSLGTSAWIASSLLKGVRNTES